jgi:beta-glucosidase
VSNEQRSAAEPRRRFLQCLGVAACSGILGRLFAACAATPAASQSGSTAKAARRFPDSFLWGAATSAYQIEGAVAEDGRGESIWDRFSHMPGKVKNGDTGDLANDHYHRYEQDLDLMREIGLQTYRFSIAWPRVLPAGSGAVNQKGLDFYRRLVDGLLKRGIQPMATLFHWDLPQALEEQGGWVNRDTAKRFADYAEVMFRALGDSVPSWLTLNEPKTVVMLGYVEGIHAPGLRDPDKAYAAMHHMLLAHGLATQAFRASTPSRRIGVALNLSPVYAANNDPRAKDAVRLRDGFENRLYLDPVLRGSYPKDVLDALQSQSRIASAIKPGDLAIIAAPIDLLGVNYYNPTYVSANGKVVPGPHPRSIASWQEIYPDGLHDLLVRIKRDYGDIEISVTENGMPSDDRPNAAGAVNDLQRLKFLHDHFEAAHRAIEAGINLTSYYVWSLMDNFEWAEGYSQRWGIVYVDFATQRRSPKRSALWYRDVIGRNSLTELPQDTR